MTDLLEIGHRIRDASSLAEGHVVRTSYYGGDGMRVFHVPELPNDGQLVRIDTIPEASAAEADMLKKLDMRITVAAVRQAGDDMLILETVFSGLLPGGAPFAFPNVLIYTVRDGAFVQLVEVASEEMWTTLRQALTAVA